MKAIELKQTPIISHDLIRIGQSVSERLEALNLGGQIATVDTVKSLKDLRTELNKELADYELQRKAVKEAVLLPYSELEAVYKTEVATKYNDAIELLKNKIAFVENEVKEAKKAVITAYFLELCEVEKIDFVAFEKMGLEINLSTTEKKYKEQVNEFISKIVDDIKLIKASEFEAETMVEYRLSLNCSKAVTTVKERKENEAAEKLRLAKIRDERRQIACLSVGMVWVDITNSFSFNNDIYITKEQIKELDVTEWDVLVDETIAKIKASISVVAPKVEPFNHAGMVVDNTTTPIAPVVLQAPTVVIAEKPVTASFKVVCERSKLIALGAYMKENNITYSNID